MIIESQVHGDKTQKVSVAFVDDNDIVTDGVEAEKNVETITNNYNDLHSAIDGHIEEEK